MVTDTGSMFAVEIQQTQCNAMRCSMVKTILLQHHTMHHIASTWTGLNRALALHHVVNWSSSLFEFEWDWTLDHYSCRDCACMHSTIQPANQIRVYCTQKRSGDITVVSTIIALGCCKFYVHNYFRNIFPLLMCILLLKRILCVSVIAMIITEKVTAFMLEQLNLWGIYWHY